MKDYVLIFKNGVEVGAIIDGKADSVEVLREWLDEDVEDE